MLLVARKAALVEIVMSVSHLYWGNVTAYVGANYLKVGFSWTCTVIILNIQVARKRFLEQFDDNRVNEDNVIAILIEK